VRPVKYCSRKARPQDKRPKCAHPSTLNELKLNNSKCKYQISKCKILRVIINSHE
jgi:hypothetical protein